MTEKQRVQRILLGHLSARGDCLYATAIARQIKADYPGCFLTWGISSMCRDVLKGNPDVDEIWEFPMQNHGEMTSAWQAFEEEAANRYRKGDFDEVFLTQISPNNFHNFDGTVRLSIFRAYPRPITVPITPVMNLLPEEIETVQQFATLHRLTERSNVILFECSSNSGQSFVTPDYALEVARNLLTKLPNISIILASAISVDSGDERIINSSTLSFRDHAELSKYCSLLVGCSSGLSWLCTSNWAKPLPTIQLLAASTSVYASMSHDFEYWEQSTEQVIEMTDCSVDRLVDCIYLTLTQGITVAHSQYHQKIPLEFTFYLSLIRSLLLEKGEYEKLFLTMLNTTKRYGWQLQLEEFMLTEVLPSLQESVRSSWLQKKDAQSLQDLYSQAKIQLEEKDISVKNQELQLQECQNSLEQAHQRIAAIESSKFWKLRIIWFKIKGMLGLKT